MRRSKAMFSRRSVMVSCTSFSNARSCSWIRFGSRWKNWRMFLAIRWRSWKRSSRSSSFSSMVACVIVRWSKHTFKPNCWSNGRAIRRRVSRILSRDTLLLNADGILVEEVLGRILSSESSRWSIDCKCPSMSCISCEFRWLVDDDRSWSLRRQNRCAERGFVSRRFYLRKAKISFRRFKSSVCDGRSLLHMYELCKRGKQSVNLSSWIDLRITDPLLIPISRSLIVFELLQ